MLVDDLLRSPTEGNIDFYNDHGDWNNKKYYIDIQKIDLVNI